MRLPIGFAIETKFKLGTGLTLCERQTKAVIVPFRRLTSKEAGYVPANYVKEIEARTVKKATKQKVIVPEKVKVKRRVKKKVIVQKQRAVKVQKTPEKKGVWNCLVPHIFFFLSKCWNKNKGQNEKRKSIKRRFMNLKSKRFSFIVCPEIFNLEFRVNILNPNECSRGLTEQCKLL